MSAPVTDLQRRQKDAVELEKTFAERGLRLEPPTAESPDAAQWFDECRQTYLAALAEARAKLGPKPLKAGGAGPANFRTALAIAQWEHDNVKTCAEQASAFLSAVEGAGPSERLRQLAADVAHWAPALERKRVALAAAQARFDEQQAPIEKGREIARRNLRAGMAKLVEALNAEEVRHETRKAAIAGKLGAARTPLAMRAAEYEREAEESRHEAACAKLAIKLEGIEAGLANVS